MSFAAVLDAAPRLVAEFIRAFDGSRDPRLWVTLVAEETKELDEEILSGDRVNALKEYADLLYVRAGLQLTTADHRIYTDEEMVQRRLVEQASFDVQAMAARTFNFGSNVVMEALHRVHQSNMSKLGDDGQPLRREDGKVLKGPNYKPADLSDLV